MLTVVCLFSFSISVAFLENKFREMLLFVSNTIVRFSMTEIKSILETNSTDILAKGLAILH